MCRRRIETLFLLFVLYYCISQVRKCKKGLFVLSFENKRRTRYIARTLDPEWHQTLVFIGISRSELPNKSLELTVWDFDRFKTDNFLGEVILSLSGKSLLWF